MGCYLEYTHPLDGKITHSWTPLTHSSTHSSDTLQMKKPIYINILYKSVLFLCRGWVELGFLAQNSLASSRARDFSPPLGLA